MELFNLAQNFPNSEKVIIICSRLDYERMINEYLEKDGRPIVFKDSGRMNSLFCISCISVFGKDIIFVDELNSQAFYEKMI